MMEITSVPPTPYVLQVFFKKYQIRMCSHWRDAQGSSDSSVQNQDHTWHKECVSDKSDNKDHSIETPGVAHFILEVCSMENLRIVEVVKTIQGYDTSKE